jgi:cytochrome c oxidase subunit 2
LLCLQDRRAQSPSSTVKVIRNQWNWQREVDEEITDHLLDIDVSDILAAYETPIVTFVGLDNRVITIRTDVLHSLGLPKMGIKLDAAPGRIRRSTFNNLVPGVVVGSCYELCGSGHRAIPINVLAILL